MRVLALALAGGAAALTLGAVLLLACASPERERGASAPAARAAETGGARSVQLHDARDADGRRVAASTDGEDASGGGVNDVIGLGPGGAGGAFYGRSAGGTDEEEEPRGIERLIQAQEADGRWSADAEGASRAHDVACPCADPDHDLDDSGTTALMLLLFLHDGHALDEGALRAPVAHAFRWLSTRQDRDSGLIGASAAVGRVYNHALATAALGEAFFFTSDPQLGASFVAALRALEAARVPGSGWTASTTGLGLLDVYVTTWAVSAFTAARELELDVDPRALADADRWLASELDNATHLVAAPNARAATAAALWARARLLTQDSPEDELTPSLQALVELQGARTDGFFECELEGTLFGTYATYIAGHGPSWKRWRRLLKEPVRTMGGEPSRTLRGYAAAVLSAAAYYRYARVLVR